MDIRDEIEEKLADFRQEVNQVFVWGYIFNILHSLYFYILNDGQDPKTVEEACQLILKLSQEEVEDAMRTMLASENDGHREKTLSLMELLEKTDKKPADKWYWSLAIRNPWKQLSGLSISWIRCFQSTSPILSKQELSGKPLLGILTLRNSIETPNSCP